MTNKLFTNLLVLVISLCTRLVPIAFADAPYDFVLTGRLTDATGKPTVGPVALQIAFFHTHPSTSPVLSVTQGFEQVTLQEGIFQVRVSLTASAYDEVFSDVSQPVWFSVTDLTHNTAPYPAQQVIMVPYAAKIPVDGKTVSFGSDGKLTVGPQTAPGANQFLSKDANGNLVWATPSGAATALQGQSLSTTAPAAGQVLTYSGGQWVPTTPVSSGGTVTSVAAALPLAVTNASTTPQLSLAQATSVANGYLSASDWIAFSGKLSATGGTMSGALDMGGAALTDLATPVNASDAATKAYVDAATSGGGAAITVFGTGDNSSTPGVGLLRGPAASGANIAGATVNFDAGNGTGTGGSGALNFLTASAGASGSTANALTPRMTITSAGFVGVGTSVPGTLLDVGGAITARGMAAPGVSAAGQGVLYFDSAAGQFKVSQNGAAFSPLTTGSAVTSVVGGAGLSGSITTVGTLSLATVGTAGSYAKVVTDAYGRVVGATTLAAADLPPISATTITAGTLGVVNGGTGAGSFTNNGVVIGSGSALSATPAGNQYNVLTVNNSNQPTFGAVNLASGAAVSGVLPVANGGTGIAATPALGQIPVGNGTGFTLTTLAAGPSAGVTVANASGTIALDTAQDIRPSASPSFAGLAISGLSSALVKANGSGALTAAAASDVTSLLGYTPVSKAGDTMAGALSVAGALSGASVNAAGSIVGATIVGATIVAQGNLTVQGNGTTANKLILNDKSATNYFALKAPDALSSSVTFTLPMGDGTGGQVLATNGAGSLSWASGLAPTGVAGGDLTGSFPNPTLAGVGTAGTYTKVVTDSKGRVIGTASLAAGDIPALPAGAITSGTLSAAILPNLSGSYVAVIGATMSGVLNLPLNGLIAGTNQFVLANGNVGIGSAAPAGKLDVAGTICLNGANCISSWPGGGTTGVTSITAGAGLAGGSITTTGSIYLPPIGTAGSYAKVVTDAYGRVTGGTTLVASDLPSITSGISGTLPVANGGTGANTFTSNGVILGNGTSNLFASGTGNAYQSLTIPSGGGVPSFGAVNLAQSAAVNGILPVANGGTGTATGGANLVFATPNGSSGAPTLRALAAADLPSHSAGLITSGTLTVANGGTGMTATPTVGQIPIGTGTSFALGTITPGAGITVTNAAGSITIAATVSAANFVAIAGSTMTGVLNLPANGLVAGTSQLVLANGNVGIGTTNPQGPLVVASGNVGIGTTPAAYSHVLYYSIRHRDSPKLAQAIT